MDPRRWHNISAGKSGMKSVAISADERTRDGGENCYYTTLVNSVCSLDKDKSGKPVQICEKTEQLLRRCSGRAQEIVESKTDLTVEDASTSSSAYLLKNGVREGPQQSLWKERFGQGGASEIEDFLSRDGTIYSGAFEELVKAAEDIVQDVFGPFSLEEQDPPRRPINPKAEEPPAGWLRRGLFGQEHRDKSKKPDQTPADYSGLMKDIQEV